MLDTHSETATATSTAAVCDSLALFGGTPERGEFDNRDTWDEDGALQGLTEALRIVIEDVTADGTQMADEREPLLWGLVNMLHAQTARLDRAVDKLIPEIKDLERTQDGGEIAAWELQLATEKARNLGDRRDAFETMRDLAADAYRVETGDVWRPRNGSHTSKTGTLTSAAIDARDYRRARKERETRAHLPEGTLVAVTGGKQVEDANAVWSVLDRARGPSTRTSYSSTAAAPASRPWRRSGPRRAASTRSCAVRTGTLTERPRRFAGTTNSSTSCPRASLRSPARASPAT